MGYNHISTKFEFEFEFKFKFEVEFIDTFVKLKKQQCYCQMK